MDTYITFYVDIPVFVTHFVLSMNSDFLVFSVKSPALRSATWKMATKQRHASFQHVQLMKFLRA